MVSGCHRRRDWGLTAYIPTGSKRNAMENVKKDVSYTFAPGPPTVEADVVNNHREETLGAMSRINCDDDQKSDCVGLDV